MPRSARRIAIVVGMALSAIALPATAANADNGDGKLGCNTGEICFSWDQTYVYQKHFWYNATHDNYKFTNVTNGVQSGYVVRDNAYAVNNKDTACSVRVIDDRGFYPDDVQVIPKNYGWVTLGSSVRNQNDRHERC